MERTACCLFVVQLFFRYLLYFLSGSAVEGYVATVTTATGSDALLPVLRRLVSVVRPISWNNTGGNGK